MNLENITVDNEVLFDVVGIIAPRPGENSNVWIRRARRELDQAMCLMQQETAQGKTCYAASIHVMGQFYDVLSGSGQVINYTAGMMA